jgi:hypothetical protein
MTTQPLVLHNYFRSSAAYRVRIAMNLKGLSYDYVPVHLTRDGGMQFQEPYKSQNPQQLVPLLDDEGFQVSQSIAIIEYLDEKPLDVKPQTLEFIYGTPDQIIKGLNIVIGTLKKGEFSKIIVPSHLAFGEKGSSNQLVQPFTPLVYNITLIDIK